MRLMILLVVNADRTEKLKPIVRGKAIKLIFLFFKEKRPYQHTQQIKKSWVTFFTFTWQI